MQRFDIISGAPKTFIFQKNSNKTNLGGIFTILFIVMIFLIILSYLYEYFANDKYKVSYTYDEIFYGLDADGLNKIYNDKKLYPEIEFGLWIREKNIKKSIKIFTFNNNGVLEEISLEDDHMTPKNVTQMNLYIFYKCVVEPDGIPNCTLREEDFDERSGYFNLFNLAVGFYGYFTDHQNPDHQ